MVAQKRDDGGWQRGYSEPVPDGYDGEKHPAWGMISAARVSNSPGSVLFDSDIRHQHTVVVRLGTASRKRDLNRDWLHREDEFVEIEMSEAQWASFVSSMNAGSGVPCTIRRRDGDVLVDSMPFQPRLAESMAEVRDVAQKTYERVVEAFDAYKEKKNVGNLRNLEHAIKGVENNLTYAAKSMNEHAENVVQRARADIEAFVVDKARQVGLDPADISSPLELTAGDDT